MEAFVPKPGRIACVVPYCRRTGKRLPDDTDETEIICGKHYRLADKKLRKLVTLAKRRLNRAYEKFKAYRETGQVVEMREQARLCDRHHNAFCKLFDRIKTQAIERAAGI